MNVKLIKYNNEYEIMVDFIINFWKEHNNVVPSIEDANENLKEWTKEGHILYFINANNENVGFVHLGSRGAEIDWLEDIFVLPKYQRQGIGTRAIEIVEDTVKKYSESLYIEVASRNINAIRLYKKIGYNCLNTITIRKDFKEEKYDNIGKEKIFGIDFDVKK
jgi:ribosomal protein S18 acetylase RimI-like enzyme